MTSNQELLNNFMYNVGDLENFNDVFETLIICKSAVEESTPLNIIFGKNAVMLGLGDLNKQTLIKFTNIDRMTKTEVILDVNLTLNVFPTLKDNNAIYVKYNNKREKCLGKVFIHFLINSHISGFIEKALVKGYVKEGENDEKKDVYLTENLSLACAVRAIRNKDKEEFNTYFNYWKQSVLVSQQKLEEMLEEQDEEGDLYEDNTEKEKQRFRYKGQQYLKFNEEAYIYICGENKKTYNELTIIDMIAEELNWWD